MTAPEKCPYCDQMIQGDLWMTVHLDEAHSDLLPLFSGEKPRPDGYRKQK